MSCPWMLTGVRWGAIQSVTSSFNMPALQCEGGSIHTGWQSLWWPLYIRARFPPTPSQQWLRFPDSIVLKDLRRLLRRIRLRRSAKIGVFPRRILNCLLTIPSKKLLKKLLVGAVHRRGAETKSIDARQIDHPPLYQHINYTQRPMVSTQRCN